MAGDLGAPLRDGKLAERTTYPVQACQMARLTCADRGKIQAVGQRAGKGA